MEPDSQPCNKGSLVKPIFIRGWPEAFGNIVLVRLFFYGFVFFLTLQPIGLNIRRLKAFQTSDRNSLWIWGKPHMVACAYNEFHPVFRGIFSNERFRNSTVGELEPPISEMKRLSSDDPSEAEGYGGYNEEHLLHGACSAGTGESNGETLHTGGSGADATTTTTTATTGKATTTTKHHQEPPTTSNKHQQTTNNPQPTNNTFHESSLILTTEFVKVGSNVVDRTISKRRHHCGSFSWPGWLEACFEHISAVDFWPYDNQSVLFHGINIWYLHIGN